MGDAMRKALGRPGAPSPEQIGRMSGSARTSAIGDLTRAVTGLERRSQNPKRWDSGRRNVQRWAKGRPPSRQSARQVARATRTRPTRRAQRAAKQGAMVRVRGNIGPVGKGQKDYKRRRASPEFELSPAQAQRLNDAMAAGDEGAARDVLQQAINRDDIATKASAEVYQQVQWDLGALGDIEDIQIEPR